MKTRIAFLSLIIGAAACLTACGGGGNTVRLFDEAQLPEASIATVSDVCDSKCKAAVKAAHKQKFDEPISGDISYPTLQVIDKKLGPNNFPMNDCGGDVSTRVYNNFWVGGYTVKLKPGEHTFGVKIQSCSVRNRSLYHITLDLKGGHTYTLGQVSKRTSGFFSVTKTYEWYPFIYDESHDKAFIYSNTSSGWLPQ
jgi:hypothetical protein